MVNFGPLPAEILSLVWGTPANFNCFRVLAALLHANLAHILVCYALPDKTRMWANAQPDGRPAEHRWRPLLNAAKFG